MVNILHLITGLETGGAEGMLSRLVARTDRNRFRSVVVSMTSTGNIAPTINGAGVELRTLGIRRGVPDPRGLFRLDRVLREVRPDILQTWLYHADLLGLLARQFGQAPRLLWNVRCSESIGSATVRSILSRFSAVPERVVVNSLSAQRFHERIGYRPRRWEHIPNGFDTAAFRPDSEARQRLRAAFDIDEAAVVIGLAARYHPMKDYATFLAAAARLAAERPEALFLLVGAGVKTSNRELMSAINAHGLTDRLRLLGERTDMAAIYASLDIGTSSSAFGEGFSNVLGESMSCCVPCVATDSGDASEILGQTGAVVPRRDPEALAAAWGALIAIGSEGRRSLGQEARARIARYYDLGIIVARYEALYDDIVGQGDASALRSGGRRPTAKPVLEQSDVPGP
jgi:glycosyltransferase involved in cell wall biosynthesis